MELLIESVSLALAFLVFGWALILHCKKPRKLLPEVVDGSNVVSMHNSKDARVRANLQLFLDAEHALANEEHERYMVLRMQALEAARENLKYVGIKDRKAC